MAEVNKTKKHWNIVKEISLKSLKKIKKYIREKISNIGDQSTKFDRHSFLKWRREN